MRPSRSSLSPRLSLAAGLTFADEGRKTSKQYGSGGMPDLTDMRKASKVNLAVTMPGGLAKYSDLAENAERRTSKMPQRSSSKMPQVPEAEASDGTLNESQNMSDLAAKQKVHHDDEAELPWWLMTPGCYTGRPEDAEDEFLVDEDGVSLEVSALKSCCVDKTTAYLLKKVSEPLRAIVLKDYDDASNFVKYRNNLKDNYHRVARVGGLAETGPRVNNIVLTQGKVLLGGPEAAHEEGGSSASKGTNAANPNGHVFPPSVFSRVKEGNEFPPSVFATTGQLLVDKKPEAKAAPKEPKSKLSFQSGMSNEGEEVEDEENDENRNAPPQNYRMRHSRMISNKDLKKHRALLRKSFTSQDSAGSFTSPSSPGSKDVASNGQSRRRRTRTSHVEGL